MSHATMKFMNLVQKPDEPTSTYIVRLREASEDCDFGDADAVNRSIREQVLLSGNNTKLKRKAMESDWNLTQIINHAKLMEDSSHQTEDMSMRRHNGNIKSNIPVIVKQEDESKKTRTRRYSHLKPDRRDTYVVKPKLDNEARKPKCGRCGFVHLQGRCPAFGKNCNKCGKKNHFSAVCRSENQKFSKQMTRHRKRDRTNKNTMEICEDRSDESDSYGDDGSDSEVEYGLISHKIYLLSLSRQSFEEELSEAEHDEIFEYDAEDEYEEPYRDMVSFRKSENDQSFTFGDRSVLGPPMQFRYEAVEMSIPPLPDLCCSETEESGLDCNDEPYEPQNENLVICPPPGFVNEAPQNEDLVICPPPSFVSETPGLMDENAHLSGVTGLEDKKLDRTSDIVKKNVEKFDNIAIRVSIAGVKMWVEINSCSSKTMIDEVVFRKILENQNITLNKLKSKVTAYGGSEIPLLGSFLTMIETKKKIVPDTIIVVKGETGSRALLAGKTALELGMLAILRRNHCFDASPDTLGEFCSMNPDLVNDGKKSQGNAKVGSQVSQNQQDNR